MKTYNITYPSAWTAEQRQAKTLALGFFDGVHLGHQKVIATAVEEAKRNDIKSAVLTFSPHPSVVLRDQQHVSYLTLSDEKRKLIAACGVDELYIIEFNEELAKLSPEAFISHFIDDLNVSHVVAGFDFSFGHRGVGTMDMLQNDTSRSFAVTTVASENDDQEKISSTRIRECIRQGDMKKATELLGRPYQLTGTVTTGEGRGRTIGIPTANIVASENSLIPGRGVYAVLVSSEAFEGKKGGMCNIGYKPTFHGDKKTDMPSIEVHLFDFADDLYDKEITVEWLAYLRSEQKFSSVDDLIAQLDKDRQDAREITSGTHNY
ncbi:bifunctional riboflavin kinase/FAD synthetase [Aureibacillus halotolerans]|uniref:Riboflavin biosynthesis protein n=1 Tax=Aureibacillus halotolerans TaxID=1508390 RepID=A0A4R6U0A6_9BACI|nr:bifunctional riboflavin kinase/FAD synthetase [Aureibacillus halotolerans]TDQ39690.1 riboflavin kinase/FMN adenylyltransferase [Aureibacillus halotolerans]